MIALADLLDLSDGITAQPNRHHTALDTKSQASMFLNHPMAV
jgi:hypothetical protein